MIDTQLFAASNSIERVIQCALSGLARNTERCYRAHISRFQASPYGSILNREHVKRYLQALERQHASAQVRNQALSALKKLAYEASEVGCLDPDIAAQVQRIKGKRITGVRRGRWLSAAQLCNLLTAPDGRTVTGRRDKAVLALLAGCGLRRAEICALSTNQVRVIDSDSDKTILENVIGKGNRIRSIAAPRWAAQIINEWKQEIDKT